MPPTGGPPTARNGTLPTPAIRPAIARMSSSGTPMRTSSPARAASAGSRNGTSERNRDARSRVGPRPATATIRCPARPRRTAIAVPTRPAPTTETFIAASMPSRTDSAGQRIQTIGPSGAGASAGGCSRTRSPLDPREQALSGLDEDGVVERERPVRDPRHRADVPRRVDAVPRRGVEEVEPPTERLAPHDEGRGGVRVPRQHPRDRERLVRDAVGQGPRLTRAEELQSRTLEIGVFLVGPCGERRQAGERLLRHHDDVGQGRDRDHRVAREHAVDRPDGSPGEEDADPAAPIQREHRAGVVQPDREQVAAERRVLVPAFAERRDELGPDDRDRATTSGAKRPAPAGGDGGALGPPAHEVSLQDGRRAVVGTEEPQHRRLEPPVAERGRDADPAVVGATGVDELDGARDPRATYRTTGREVPAPEARHAHPVRDRVDERAGQPRRCDAPRCSVLRGFPVGVEPGAERRRPGR